MANHCYNNAYFTGKRKDIERLVKRIKNLKKKELVENPATYEWQKDLNSINLWAGNYHKLLYKGPDLVEGPSRSNFDVYDRYGSKWFELYAEIQEYNSPDELGLIISGDSAWSPMLPLFSKLCVKYNLTCEGSYEESGMDFAGKYTIDAEGYIDDNHMSYRDYRLTEDFQSYFDEVLMWIEDGYYDEFNDVLNLFNPDFCTLSTEELQQLRDTFDKFIQEKEKENESVK